MKSNVINKNGITYSDAFTTMVCMSSDVEMMTRAEFLNLFAVATADGTVSLEDASRVLELSCGTCAEDVEYSKIADALSIFLSEEPIKCDLPLFTLTDMLTFIKLNTIEYMTDEIQKLRDELDEKMFSVRCYYSADFKVKWEDAMDKAIYLTGIYTELINRCKDFTKLPNEARLESERSTLIKDILVHLRDLSVSLEGSGLCYDRCVSELNDFIKALGLDESCCITLSSSSDNAGLDMIAIRRLKAVRREVEDMDMSKCKKIQIEIRK